MLRIFLKNLQKKVSQTLKMDYMTNEQKKFHNIPTKKRLDTHEYKKHILEENKTTEKYQHKIR